MQPTAITAQYEKGLAQLEQDPTASIHKACLLGKDNEQEKILTEDKIKRLTQVMPNTGPLLTTELAIWIYYHIAK